MYRNSIDAAFYSIWKKFKKENKYECDLLPFQLLKVKKSKEPIVVNYHHSWGTNETKIIRP